MSIRSERELQGLREEMAALRQELEDLRADLAGVPEAVEEYLRQWVAREGPLGHGSLRTPPVPRVLRDAGIVREGKAASQAKRGTT